MAKKRYLFSMANDKMKSYKETIKNLITKESLKILCYTAFLDAIFFMIAIAISKYLMAPKMMAIVSRLKGVAPPSQMLDTAVAQQNAELLSTVIITAILFFIVYWLVLFALVGLKNTFIYSLLHKEKQRYYKKFIILNLMFGLICITGIILLAIIAKTQFILSVLYGISGVLLLHMMVSIQCFLQKNTMIRAIKKGIFLAFRKFHVFFGVYLLIFILWTIIMNLLNLIPSEITYFLQMVIIFLAIAAMRYGAYMLFLKYRGL